MEFFDAVAARRSVRSYTAQPVAHDDIMQIIRCASMAPSAKNRQPWKFIVVTDADIKQKILEATKGQRFILTAPAIIAAVADDCEHVSTNGNISHLVDLAIAGEHIALAAAALNLGTCWIAAFYQEKMRAALGVPQSAHVVAIFTLGYSSDTVPQPAKKPYESIVCENSWAF
jgi:nitroreductase